MKDDNQEERYYKGVESEEADWKHSIVQIWTNKFQTTAVTAAAALWESSHFLERYVYIAH